MRCQSCQQENPDQAKFCMGCGTRLFPEAAPPPVTRDRPVYTPAHLSEKVLTSRSALQGERKQVTVLFADVKGSVDLSSQLDPEEWHQILDRFFQILTSGVHRFEGTVNQYTGDGIMALFGAPIAHEDHAQRACYAALHLSEHLRSYANELRLERGLNFSVRMGLNSGDVVVGQIGDDLRRDYTAQGLTVGLASRMEQLAEPGKVFLTESTARQVTGYFELRELGSARVGSDGEVGTFELVGVGRLRTRLDAARARGFSKFVGRKKELGALEAALEQALDGSAQVVAVVAEAGIGKSRLCYEFVQLCRERGLEVHQANALPHAQAVPFLPILEYLRDYFGIGESDSDETARDKIAGRVVRLAEELTEALPLLYDFLGVADPERPAPAMDPEAREARLFDVMHRITHARSERHPAVLVVEDLHWLDPGSERFLENLIASLPGTRTLLVVNFRPEYEPPWTDKRYYRTLLLEPLGPEASDELLAHLLGEDPSVRALPDLIRERTRGNPFFIEELVQVLVEDGILAGTRGAHRLVAPLEQLPTPQTVQALVASRIDGLGERAKQLLQVASVIGKRFSRALLESVSELSRPELSAALRHLIDRGFVYERALSPAAEYSFQHPLTQETAYGTQLQQSRAHTHAALASRIILLDPERRDERSALIADHWERAGESLEAARWHRRAAVWAGVAHPAESLRHWRRVPVLLRRVPETVETLSLAVGAYVRILLLGLRMGMSEDEAKRMFEQGKALASKSDDPRLLGGLIVRYAAMRGTAGAVEEALDLARQVLRLADESRSAATVWAARIGVVHWAYYLGRLRAGLRMAERNLESPPEDLNVGTEFLTYRPYIQLSHFRGIYLMRSGRLDEARESLARALALAEEYGEVELPGWVRTSQGRLAYFEGDAGAALSHARAGLDLADRTGSAFSLVHAYHATAPAHLLRREWSEAIAASKRGLALARENRTGLFLEAELLGYQAQAHLGRAEIGPARALIDASLALARQRGARVAELTALLARARLLIRSGGGARSRAEPVLRQVERLIEQTGAATYRAYVHRERAELARAQGDRGTRERELRLARLHFQDSGARGRAARITAELDALS